MGVEWDDCEEVGKLIGIKTIINEFVAYSELADMQKNNEISVRILCNSNKSTVNCNFLNSLLGVVFCLD